VVRRQKFRDLVKKLNSHDKRFQIYEARGKGSEVLLYHPDIGGRPQSFPVTHHSGQEIGQGMLKAIIRRFNLPSDIFA